MLKIFIKLDIEKDAWNWWHACNKISHGVDWKTKIEPYLREKIVGKTQEESYVFLIPFLEKFYHGLDIQIYIQKIQAGFDGIQDKIFERMEKVTNRPICRQNFTGFLTSFPRFPYDYERGYIWFSCQKPIDYQISIFIHELLHFQFFAYFGEKVWDELGPQKHAELKEAMTVILDEEFQDITLVKDEGYERHRDLRKKLLALWEQNKNMDSFIAQSISLLK